MAKLSQRVLLRVGVIIAVPILLLGGRVLLDQIPMSAARPPGNIQTLEDFQNWKRAEIVGTGTFSTVSVTYTVVLAPAGRYLASGRSAYLFDEQGRFVDWTPDMGDIYTVKNGFTLTGGRVENITRKQP